MKEKVKQLVWFLTSIRNILFGALKEKQVYKKEKKNGKVVGEKWKTMRNENLLKNEKYKDNKMKGNGWKTSQEMKTSQETRKKNERQIGTLRCGRDKNWNGVTVGFKVKKKTVRRQSWECP